MTTTKNEVLKDYLIFRGLKNKTKHGLENIEYQIKKFLNHTKTPLKDFDEKILTSYVSQISKEYSTTMLNIVKSSYLKNFLKWYFVDWSSRFRNLNSICQTEKSDPTYDSSEMLSEDDVKTLVQKENSVFWKSFFLTLFYGGCRPVELVNLKWENLEFDEDGAYITIYSKKNKRTFIKFVPSDVSFFLKQLQNNNSEYVFYNFSTKRPITVKGAYWKIRQMSEKYLGKKINLYILRHSIATIIYNKDDIKDTDIAEQMGHTKSMKSTYVHNNKAKLKERAKRIYVSAEVIPEEKRNRLEKEIQELKKQQSKEIQEIKKRQAQDRKFFEDSLKKIEDILF